MVLALMFVAESHAGVSSAAVLFLRIAPGARAAAMGEAYVALADDATATHWNPAGLGTYPLSDSWNEARIPTHLRPIEAVAALNVGGGSDFKAYEIWAVTPKGLARYDHKKWYEGEVFNTRTDDTIERLVAQVIDIDDPEKLAELAAKVAHANSAMSFEELEEIQQTILRILPEDFDKREAFVEDLDSLVASYVQCRINWDKVRDLQQKLSKFEDGVVPTRDELFDLSLTIEKSRNRFIAEEIKIPFHVMISGDINAIATVGDRLMIGTSEGLVVYSHNKWRTFTTLNGLPSNNVLTLAKSYRETYVGTDSGMVRLIGAAVVSAPGGDELPEGAVSAISGERSTELWIVVDDDLYHYDGYGWSNTFEYTVALEDTPEKLAERFAIWGTETEKAAYLAKMQTIPQPVDVSAKIPTSTAVTAEAEAVAESVEDSTVITEGSADSTVAVAEVAVDVTAEEAIDITAEESETVSETIIGLPADLVAGQKIALPYITKFKGEVSSLHKANGKLWVGTDLGLLVFDDSWATPGYSDITVGEGQTLDSFVTQYGSDGGNLAAADYNELLDDINDLHGAEPEVGSVIKVYRNSVATQIRNINSYDGSVYISAAGGTIVHDGSGFSRADIRGMGAAGGVDVLIPEGEPWFASEDRVVLYIKGHTDISTMYVKWLPTLADDLYYAFLAGTKSFGDLGTFGASMTMISLGEIQRTNEDSPDVMDTFDAFDVAFAGSYGRPISSKLAVGITMKFIYSHLSDQGTKDEKGSGTSTGFAFDFGLIHKTHPRLDLAMALTNVGPQMFYIDAAQSDPLPRNLAVGFAWKAMQTDYYHLLLTAEANKMLVDFRDGFDALQLVFNGGGEFNYNDLFALRAGYIRDQEGAINKVTLGFGLAPLSWIKFDFAYIPSSSEKHPLDNTIRTSISIMP